MLYLDISHSQTALIRGQNSGSDGIRPWELLLYTDSNPVPRYGSIFHVEKMRNFKLILIYVITFNIPLNLLRNKKLNKFYFANF